MEILQEDSVNMKNDTSISIIGGCDELSMSIFKNLKKQYKSTIFINLISTNNHDKNLYNFKYLN